MLAFGGCRTHHRLMVAIEDAGWEIREMLMYVFGQGFPKSLNIGKQIDKMAGAERDVVGRNPNHRISKNGDVHSTLTMCGEPHTGNGFNTIPFTDAAKQWDGWGSALKPAYEPIVLCRKPVEGTIAGNVLKWGVGGLNIDGCRIDLNGDKPIAGNRTATFGNQKTISGGDGSGGWNMNKQGRFPANFCHDGSDEVMELFPNTGKSTGGQSGVKKSGLTYSSNWKEGENSKGCGFGDSGSAARFFYCSKASKKERNAGCEELPENRPDTRTDTGMGTWTEKGVAKQSNDHPTVKPIKLMRYLARLITPPGGTILDPFAGSGSTGVAAREEGFNSILIELDAHYCEIAKRRCC
jgi:site-specific DNA-methyltransferase (adenine-specific)